MIVIMDPKAPEVEINKIKKRIEECGCTVQLILGEAQSIYGLVGDTSRIDPIRLEANESVEKVLRITEPFKRANKLFHPDDTVIKVDNAVVGGNKIAIIAGPCCVESEEQIISIAENVKKSGATFLRGGAYKPRTSPYSFQGMQEDGLTLLRLAKEKTGLPIVTELMSTQAMDRVTEYADVIQIGARNMQNFDLLKEVGKLRKPILLKRGLCATVEEFLMSAEYIMAGGNEQVILCERGIRTFETYTRNTLDLSIVPAIKKLSHLPIIIDPSHAAGIWWMVESLSKAAIAVGADGIMVEVHNDPTNALCDGAQSIKPKRFDSLVKSLREIAKINGRCIE